MRLATKYRHIFAMVMILIWPGAACPQGGEVEVEFLLQAIGTSECSFIRNGKRYSATSAEEHLRMKYHKAHRHVSGGDDFINKLASESSLTGRAYSIDCGASGEQSTQTWLTAKLSGYRLAN